MKRITSKVSFLLAADIFVLLLVCGTQEHFTIIVTCVCPSQEPISAWIYKTSFRLLSGVNQSVMPCKQAQTTIVLNLWDVLDYSNERNLSSLLYFLFLPWLRKQTIPMNLWGNYGNLDVGFCDGVMYHSTGHGITEQSTQFSCIKYLD